MPSPLEALEIYLLSKMTAADRVQAALNRLGVSVDEMGRVAADVAAALKLDEHVQRADAYGEMIGPPLREHTLSASETSESFVGSLRREYQLPLWPGVCFVVNRHPREYAWGVQFEKSGDPQVPSDLERIEPWEWTRDSLVPAASSEELVDRWTDFLEVNLTFARANGPAATFFARFDLGLLQIWRPGKG